jgi:hypothetical protein
MQKSPEMVESVFKSDRVVMMSSALTYKAGLDRTDVDLLSKVSALIDKKMCRYQSTYAQRSFENSGLESGLVEVTKDVKKDLENRNIEDKHDELNDARYLDYNEDDQEIRRQESYNEVAELLTLHGDILRNTKIATNTKRKELRQHIKNYRLLIMEVVEQFKFIIERTDFAELFKAFDLKDGSREVGERVIRKVMGLMLQAIPTSAIMHIAEHLSNPKIPRSLEAIIDEESDYELEMLYILVLYVLDAKKGEKKLRAWLKKHQSYVLESMAWTCIKIEGHSRKLKDSEIKHVVKLLDDLRGRFKPDTKKKPPFLVDSFQSDIKNEFLKSSDQIN